ncbi:MAG: DUF4250 domain-containing protein, partial [Muribaculaceae bacterium]|nr:DUF4250 domain-containing protein [Muribaculaceae bacterium]
MSLPEDPFMLLSVINTRLRDDFPTLEELCASLDIDKDALLRKLADPGFEYKHQIN